MARKYDYYDALAGADPSEVEELPWGEDPDLAAELWEERFGENEEEKE